MASVGTILGALHTGGADFAGRRTNALSLKGWNGLYASLTGRLDAIEPGLEALVEETLAELNDAMPALRLPQGVIHADLFPDNVFFAGDAVSGVIDFYFACYDALAYDVAVTLNAWCFTPNGTFAADKATALVMAYQKKRAFTRDEIAAFPILLQGAALRFLLTRAYDWLNHPPGALVIPHNPLEYAVKLRFHRGMKDVGLYGL